MNRSFIPLILFILLAVLLAVGLKLDPREVPSPFIDKAAPQFSLPQLHQPEQSFTPQQMLGQVWVLNVWASWCVSCRAEHKVITHMAQQLGWTIVGLNYKDNAEDAKRWLQQFGDPYRLSAHDLQGDVGIDYGVYGVPESFIIDKQGIIRYKQIGPVTMEAVTKTLLPLMQQLERE